MARPKSSGSSNGNNGSGGGGSTPNATPESSPPYKVLVTSKFLLLSVSATILLAFTCGRAARLFVLDGLSKSLLYPDPADSSMFDRPDYHELLEERAARKKEEELLEERLGKKQALPEPKLMEGKEAPRTVYSSKNFDTAASLTSSSVHMVNDAAVHKDGTTAAGTTSQAAADKPSIDGWQVCETDNDGKKTCTRGSGGKIVSAEEEEEEEAEKAKREVPTVFAHGTVAGNGGDDSSDDEEEEEEHLPAGQHLLVDIKNVDGSFLNSEARLAQAMIDVVASAQLTLLSYHCHSLLPMGVSCVGVLLESHVSFHTWPDEGVITLDLFTCGSNPLVPVMPVIEKAFAVPMEGRGVDDPEPMAVWGHKLRGFRDHAPGHAPKPLESDMGKYLLGYMDFDMKREVVSHQSKYQRIDVYEVIRPRFRDLFSYKRSLSDDGSYESKHPEIYRPDRVIFLDGVMQSTLYGLEAYHEALVHPGMLAHPNPKRVAIIGGGEGATLREVLKHNTVETATMIEIDEEMVQVSHEHIPSWSDCSDLVGRADWCVEDDVADMRYEDALAWFTDRFSVDGSKKGGEEGTEPFDVIIMDALDPTDNVPFAEALYDNADFLRALYDGMSQNGVIVMQLGESPAYADGPDSAGRDKNRATITRLLEEAGFESLHVYEEAHSEFMYPWSYLVALKDYKSRTLWYQNSAEIELAIQNRIVPTKAGSSPLKYFDGATMVSYQVPHKAFETVFCREVPTPEECLEDRGFDPTLPNAPASSFEVRRSGEKGFGLYAKVDIPEDTMIAAEVSSTAVKVKPSTYEMMDAVSEKFKEAKELKKVTEYMHKYGFQTQIEGEAEYRVDSGILTFVNHGCDGTENTGSEVSQYTEATIDINKMPAMHGKLSDSTPHHIVLDRHMDQALLTGDVALRDIKAGEEITNNYLGFIGEAIDWDEGVRELRKWCGIDNAEKATGGESK